MRRRFLLIANPASGRGHAPVRAELLRRLLGEMRGEAEVRLTRAAGDARRFARETDAELVLAVGGDGTISEAANGLLDVDAGIPLLPVSAGTANVIALELGLPDNLPDLAALALEAPARSFDAGELAGAGVVPDGRRRFLMSAGAGFDAQVVRDLHGRRRGPITHASYMGPLWRTWRRYDYPRLTLTSPGAETGTGVSALFANTAKYGGGLVPAPAARPDDGRLDALVFDAKGKWDWPALAWKAWRRRLLTDRRIAWRVRETYELAADRPVPLQADGDEAGELRPDAPLTARTLPGALQLIARA